MEVKEPSAASSAGRRNSTLPLADMQAIVRPGIEARRTSITRMIRHYLSRKVR